MELDHTSNLIIVYHIYVEYECDGGKHKSSQFIFYSYWILSGWIRLETVVFFKFFSS